MGFPGRQNTQHFAPPALSRASPFTCGKFTSSVQILYARTGFERGRFPIYVSTRRLFLPTPSSSVPETAISACTPCMIDLQERCIGAPFVRRTIPSTSAVLRHGGKVCHHQSRVPFVISRVKKRLSNFGRFRCFESVCRATRPFDRTIGYKSPECTLQPLSIRFAANVSQQSLACALNPIA